MALLVDLDTCAKLQTAARAGVLPPSAATTQRQRRPFSDLVTPLPTFATTVVLHPATERRVAIYCCFLAGGGDTASWFAMDARCFHGKGDLSEGSVVQSVLDIEDLSATSLSSGSLTLCVQCPGHGYLFALATGDNCIPNPKFEGGRMRVDCLKAVKGMQRPYLCTYDESAGLYVAPAAGGRYASD